MSRRPYNNIVPHCNNKTVPPSEYSISGMKPSNPAGERLRRLLSGAGLDTATASKIAGFPHRSGLQYHVDSTQPYFHPRVVAKLVRLIGHGSPAITEAQIQALAIIGSSAESGGYPQLPVTDKSQLFGLDSGSHAGRAPDDRGGKAMEAALLRSLIEDVGDLKKRVSDLETEIEELRHPTEARRRRT
jgi:hypothetical protein